MLDPVIDEQLGRQIRVGNHWLPDWASCNYLGFDLDEEVIASTPELVARWGTHPFWSRLLGNPRPHLEIEEQLTDLLGSEDVMALPMITHIHMSVIPVLAGEGTILLHARAHKTLYDAAMVAAGRGAQVLRFGHNDSRHLESVIRGFNALAPRVIALDGVSSMTANVCDLPEFSRIALQYDALLYVDDAHGFGVIGERSPRESCPYGPKGNSIFRHQGVSYGNAAMVAGLSKAYSSLLAFLALTAGLKQSLKVLAPAYLDSGPSPVASAALFRSCLDPPKRNAAPEHRPITQARNCKWIFRLVSSFKTVPGPLTCRHAIRRIFASWPRASSHASFGSAAATVACPPSASRTRCPASFSFTEASRTSSVPTMRAS
ncbi:MAG TPA: pyridoxal phosphate-dependent aminotransferase family protein [Burkholderiaceae bacterium]|nr:pyridoxal phosphate-dependent aminotransferase family protein [Burkholderiaceae bacterium]